MAVWTLGICKYGYIKAETSTEANWSNVIHTDPVGEVEVVWGRYISDWYIPSSYSAVPTYCWADIIDLGILLRSAGPMDGWPILHDHIEGLEYTLYNTYRSRDAVILDIGAEAVDRHDRVFPNSIYGTYPDDPTIPGGATIYIIYGDYIITDHRIYYKGSSISFYLGALRAAAFIEDPDTGEATDAKTGLPNTNGTHLSFDLLAGIYSRRASNTHLGDTVQFYAYSGTTAAQSKRRFFEFINQNAKKVEVEDLESASTDPYAQAGQSGPGGGTGNVDNTSEPVDFPDLPEISATDTGLVTLYNPTQLQLKSLADYMWSDSAFDIDNFRKLFADPMDCILGLSILPVNINTSETRTVYVGNMSTGISMNFVESQYVAVDCGTLNINEYWGAYIDYAPYTKCEIYLPFIGFRPLDTDVIMNKPLHVKYHVDLLSGTCVAFIKAGDSVVYSFIGQCSIEVPITGSSYGNMIQGVLGIAGSVGSLVASGGASAPSALSDIASTAVDVVKPEIQKSGAYSGGGALLGIQKPYLVITRPRQAVPANQNKYLGYPSFITKKIGDISGYTEMEQLRLHDLGATEAETEEIRGILEGGVIL